MTPALPIFGWSKTPARATTPTGEQTRPSRSFPLEQKGHFARVEEPAPARTVLKRTVLRA